MDKFDAIFDMHMLSKLVQSSSYLKLSPSREAQANKICRLLENGYTRCHFSPIIIQGSRGMGKSFFLQHLMNSESVPLVSVAAKMGRVLVAEEYTPGEDFFKNLFLDHIMKVFEGKEVEGIKFGDEECVKFRMWRCLVQLADYQTLVDELIRLTNIFFKVKVPLLPIVIFDGILVMEVSEIKGIMDQIDFSIPIIIAGGYCDQIPHTASIQLELLPVEEMVECGKQVFEHNNQLLGSSVVNDIPEREYLRFLLFLEVPLTTFLGHNYLYVAKACGLKNLREIKQKFGEFHLKNVDRNHALFTENGLTIAQKADIIVSTFLNFKVERVTFSGHYQKYLMEQGYAHWYKGSLVSEMWSVFSTSSLFNPNLLEMLLYLEEAYPKCGFIECSKYFVDVYFGGIDLIKLWTVFCATSFVFAFKATPVFGEVYKSTDNEVDKFLRSIVIKQSNIKFVDSIEAFDTDLEGIIIMPESSMFVFQGEGKKIAVCCRTDGKPEGLLEKYETVIYMSPLIEESLEVRKTGGRINYLVFLKGSGCFHPYFMDWLDISYKCEGISPEINV